LHLVGLISPLLITTCYWISTGDHSASYSSVSGILSRR